jgi:peptidoglycan/LPS O-acetylase OafA/YrhL
MILMIAGWNIPFNYKTNGEGYMNFFLGTLLAELMMRAPVKKEILAFANLFIFSVIIISVYLFRLEAMPGNGIWIFSCICANLFCMALYGNYFARFLSLPPLQILGKCSFSVYLWHIPVVRAYLIAEKRLHLFDLAPKLNFILYVLILIALSVLPAYGSKKFIRAEEKQ